MPEFGSGSIFVTGERALVTIGPSVLVTEASTALATGLTTGSNTVECTGDWLNDSGHCTGYWLNDGVTAVVTGETRLLRSQSPSDDEIVAGVVTVWVMDYL